MYPYLSIKSLKKIYNNCTVLNNIQLSIKKPGIYLFAGPNGSGKTTFLEIIVGLRKQTEGEILISGYKPNTLEAKSKLVFLSQQNSLRKSNYVREELDLIIDIYGIDKIDPIVYLSKFGLENYYKYRTNKLSGGIKRRLLISMTFLPGQSIVLLDEPVSGLDAYSRNEIWNMITEFSKDRIIMVSDHYINQAAQYVDYVYLLDEGRIIKQGQVSNIIKTFPKTHVIKVRKDKHIDIDKELKELGIDSELKVSGTIYNYYIDSSAIAFLNNLSNKDFMISPVDFEDIYFYYTGKYSYDGGVL